jgi:hypothetical protein
VILDGENCWEHYPGGGVSFLRALYERCLRTRDLQPVQIGTFLEKYPPRDTLPHLFAGSWIHHNFAIWIGHEEDNTAWDALHRAHEHLLERSQQGHIPSEQICRAWEEIYIAEGSDWFWWFGEDHSSAQDALFDYLFRKHLQNVYFVLGDPPPPELARPISGRGQRPIHTLPRAFLNVKVDGRRTFFEWLSAGRYTCQNERGTMAMAAPGPMKDVYFGFDPQTLLIRIDFDGPARTALPDFDALRIGFVEPAGCEVLVTDLSSAKPLGQIMGPSPERSALDASHATACTAPVDVAIDQIVEVAIPFQRLRVTVDQPIQFFIELLQGGQSRDRAPREGTINLSCPSPYFEQIMWDV